MSTRATQQCVVCGQRVARKLLVERACDRSD